MESGLTVCKNNEATGEKICFFFSVCCRLSIFYCVIVESSEPDVQKICKFIPLRSGKVISVKR